MSGSVKRMVLRCDHVLIFRNAPRRGELLWCPRCQDYSENLGRDLREFAAKCHSCSATSWHGQDKDGARYAVQRHAMRRPGHRPYVTYLAPPKERARADNEGDDVAYG